MDEISLQRLYNKYKNINYIEPKYDLKAIVIITIVLLYIYHTTQSGRKLNIRDFKPAFKNDNSLTGPLWVIILISLIIISIIGDNFDINNNSNNFSLLVGVLPIFNIFNI